MRRDVGEAEKNEIARNLAAKLDKSQMVEGCAVEELEGLSGGIAPTLKH